MKGWEYLHITRALDADYIQRDLDDYGSDGWELVSSILIPDDEGEGLIHFFFKRPKRVRRA